MVMTVTAEDVRFPPRPTPLRALAAAGTRHRHRQTDRAAARAIAHHGPRHRADMGLETDTPREGWDALRPNGYLVHHRR
jgi:hypothetical protein